MNWSTSTVHGVSFENHITTLLQNDQSGLYIGKMGSTATGFGGAQDESLIDIIAAHDP